MPFRTSAGSATTAGTGRLFIAGSADLEVWVTKPPGSPDFYIGGTDLVDQYTGILVTDEIQFHFGLRAGDQLWIRGTDPSTSSIAHALIRTA